MATAHEVSMELRRLVKSTIEDRMEDGEAIIWFDDVAEIAGNVYVPEDFGDFIEDDLVAISQVADTVHDDCAVDGFESDRFYVRTHRLIAMLDHDDGDWREHAERYRDYFL